jgi:hypothetical protein
MVNIPVIPWIRGIDREPMGKCFSDRACFVASAVIALPPMPASPRLFELVELIRITTGDAHHQRCFDETPAVVNPIL